MTIAEVRSCCGRYTLFVCGLALAMEGDACRQFLPEEASEPIPRDEWNNATIDGKPIKDMPFDIVQFFRGEQWAKRSLEWVATEINNRAARAEEVME